MIKICHGNCRAGSSNLIPEDIAGHTQTRQPGAQQALSFALESHVEDVRYEARPHTHIAAIDNSLSWPIHHPNSWRSYCYGWLFLPSSLIGLPFSQSTRDRFLPLLTDPKWLAQTVFELRQLFSTDSDFSESMFRKQISVFKGQAWNLVMTLRDPDAGPLELCRRQPRLVHDDEIIVADDQMTRDLLEAAAKPGQSSTSIPPLRRPSTSGPIRGAGSVLERRQSEQPLGIRQSRPASRPLPLSKHVDLSRATFGNASGVAMIEHMDRLQKKEEEHSDAKHEFDDSDELSFSNGSSKLSNIRQGLSFDDTRRGLGSRFRSGSLDTSRIASQPLPQAVSAHTATRVVIVERVVEVDARPYFVRC